MEPRGCRSSSNGTGRPSMPGGLRPSATTRSPTSIGRPALTWQGLPTRRRLSRAIDRVMVPLPGLSLPGRRARAGNYSNVTTGTGGHICTLPAGRTVTEITGRS